MRRKILKRISGMEEVPDGNSLQSPTEKRFHGVAEFAAIFGVHPDTIRREIKGGNIRFARIGDRILIPSSETERLCR
jgi:excisionase family DNA binding protein